VLPRHPGGNRALDNVYIVADADNDAAFALLHRLRLRGFLPSDDGSGWDGLAVDGLVAIDQGRVRLTGEGRDRHARWAKAEPGSDASIAAETAYARFQPVNERLLRACHSWQIARGGIPNDHTDPAYDERVIGLLRGVHGSARSILRDLVPMIPRFAEYEHRLEDALTQLQAGGRQWFASPACDSYHTVWMQLHEDLLLATGRSRDDEATQ
jgi:hypothetical protein